MPGTIRVSVLEAVELPKGLKDGEIGDNITAKVTLGPKLCKTPPLKIAGGEIQPWNSDFAFPVMNLRDKLGISICDGEDRSVSQTAIEIPSIIQKGSRDEFVELGEGGRIHLRMSFTLSDEERKKIETMRVAALKKKEEESLKKTVLFQAVPQPTAENTIKTPPVSAVAITEVQDSTTDDKDSKGTAPVSTMATTEVDFPTANGLEGTENGVLGNGSTADDENGSKETGNGIAKSQTPKPMFNYAKAIGMQKSRSVRRSTSIKRRVNPGGSENSTGVMADNGNVHPEAQIVGETGQGGGEVASSEISTKLGEAIPEVQTANESAMDPRGVDLSANPKSGGTNPEVQAVTESVKDTNLKDVGSSENTKLEDSVVSPRTPPRAASLVADSTEITPTATRPLSDQRSSAELNALDTVKTRITKVSSKVARVTRVSSKAIRATRVTSTVARVTRVAWLRDVLQKAVSNVKQISPGVEAVITWRGVSRTCRHRWGCIAQGCGWSCNVFGCAVDDLSSKRIILHFVEALPDGYATWCSLFYHTFVKVIQRAAVDAQPCNGI